MTDWLPDLIEYNDYGDWDEYLKVIHGVFQDDFVRRQPPTFRGARMGVKKHPIVDGLEATFWHFISTGKGSEDDRVPDFRRCERIAWPRPIIEAVDDGRVRCWPTERRGEIRMVLAVEDFSYVVIIAVRKEYVLPWTAYFVEHEHRRKKLRKEYERWEQSS